MYNLHTLLFTISLLRVLYLLTMFYLILFTTVLLLKTFANVTRLVEGFCVDIILSEKEHFPRNFPSHKLHSRTVTERSGTICVSFQSRIASKAAGFFALSLDLSTRTRKFILLFPFMKAIYENMKQYIFI